ncbi:MAG: 1-deoxy-D-xylulose-5-phosphate synthase [Clostridia bacterium]|nr:1-deoxy-D-xylulose-5-phosphate synthase [Clostridia bacterium]
MVNVSDAELKKMSMEELETLCSDLRGDIIDAVRENGGHLSSNLGMVELTVALHRVFDFPRDKIVFDVGHQCYAHKMLSGRAEGFKTLRRRGGLSGFPKREESEFDSYNTGHAGTSISAALGIAKARDIQGESYDVIAVIGDGSFNNGLVYEAFNSLRLLDTNILVIINDNGMSISETVGSMHEYLTYLSSDPTEEEKKEKHALIFERFGFSYDRVYDGNDIGALTEKLEEVKKRLKTESVILHVTTLKGKGYAFCEENPEATHGMQPGDEEKPLGEYSKMLGDTLTALAEKDKKIVAVTAAMTTSLGLSGFFEKFPERSIDVGICEEHAAILCAALASRGLKPYYTIYSTFLQRSIDEIIVDICAQNLPVTLCVDRAGVSGHDGETHQGVFDLSFLGFIPSLTILVPGDVDEFEKMVDFSAGFSAPLAIRYPHFAKRKFTSGGEFVPGKWKRLTPPGRYIVLACGERALSAAFDAAAALEKKGVTIGIVNASTVKPLDTVFLDTLEERYVITVEDNMLLGGFGAAVDTYLSGSGKIVRNIAYGDVFIPHGDIDELMTEFGVCAKAISGWVLENEN